MNIKTLETVRETPYDVLIIGAGMAGLSAAKVLEAQGLSVALVDKGRGLGGRLATRRMGELRLDHGGQYFTASDARFQAEVDAWLEQGIVKPWFDSLSFQDGTPDAHPRPRYIPTEAGMTSLPKALAQSLNADAYLGQRVIKLTQDDQKWQAHLEDGAILEGRQLIVTAPVPQTLALLDASGIALSDSQAHALAGVEYAPSIAVMAVTKHGSPAFKHPQGVAFTDDSSVRWLACNVAKYDQTSENQQAFTVHSTPNYAKAHFDDPLEDLQNDLLSAVEGITQISPSDYDTVQVHRWRYALVETPLASPVFALDLPTDFPPCYLAGDAFGMGSKIETAWLSGLETGLRLKDRAKSTTKSTTKST
ncbi:MAG: NAD(P)/FAD-dependent oxidoreductase [Vampirovibrionales bacterium]